jgi:hypothetical protein
VEEAFDGEVLAGEVGHGVRGVVVEDADRGAAIAEYIADLTGLEAVVDRDRDDARLGGADERLQGLDAVPEVDGDRVPRPEPGIAERVRQLRRPAVERLERQLPAPVDTLDDGGCVRLFSGVTGGECSNGEPLHIPLQGGG